MKYDIIIIGAGVVGTSIAYNLIPYDVSVLLLDKNNDVAMGSTRANSAIVHAGFDPKPGTLMAKLNVEGCALYEDLCKDLSVPYKRCGSVVLAFSEEEKALLSELLDRGNKNGVPDLRILDQKEIRELEPCVSDEAIAALYAPSAGIVSPWELCLAQAEVFVRNGGTFIGESEVTGISKNEDSDGRFTVKTNNGAFEADTVILACGLRSDKVHEFVAEADFKIIPTRGEYYLLDKCEASKANTVIFQCPNKDGKGILVAPTVHGNLICGPTSEVLTGDPEDTATTAGMLAVVKEKATKSVKNISWRDNIRNFSGVRANTDTDDFIIREIPDNKGIFEAAGIKSPGLASSPAIGRYMIGLLKENGVALPEKSGQYDMTRKTVHFRYMSNEERAELVAKDPAYGRIVCRCEGVTEGEIRDAIKSPIPPKSLDAIKRRAGTGMGRCQGGFCGPRIVQMLLARQGEAVSPLSILQDGTGSNLFTSRDEEVES